jgi:hypothetical protein
MGTAPTTATVSRQCKATILHKANVNRRQSNSNQAFALKAFKPLLFVSKEADDG